MQSNAGRWWLSGSVLMLACAVPARLAAQAAGAPWRIGAFAGAGSWFRQDVEAPAPARGSRLVLALQVDRRLSGPISLSLTGIAAAAPYACAGGCGAGGRGVEVSARARLVSDLSGLRAYALAGYGVLDQDGAHGRFHVGLGLDLGGSARVALRFEGRYLYTPDARPQDGYLLLIGPSYGF